jgi:hypothetical protein
MTVNNIDTIRVLLSHGNYFAHGSLASLPATNYLGETLCRMSEHIDRSGSPAFLINGIGASLNRRLRLEESPLSPDTADGWLITIVDGG